MALKVLIQPARGDPSSMLPIRRSLGASDSRSQASFGSKGSPLFQRAFRNVTFLGSERQAVSQHGHRHHGSDTVALEEAATLQSPGKTSSILGSSPCRITCCPEVWEGPSGGMEAGLTSKTSRTCVL